MHACKHRLTDSECGSKLEEEIRLGGKRGHGVALNLFAEGPFEVGSRRHLQNPRYTSDLLLGRNRHQTAAADPSVGPQQITVSICDRSVEGGIDAREQP